MLDQLTAATFTPYLNDMFTITLPGGIMELQLVEVAELGAKQSANTASQPRQPFSLIFLEPGGLYLPQQIYQLTHPVLGVLDIFLVPISKHSDGLRLQAVFN